MTLIINHPEADRLAQELASRTGEPIDEAIVKAMQERLERQPQPAARNREDIKAKLRALADEFSKLPVLDPRPVDGLLDYDEDGLPR